MKITKERIITFMILFIISCLLYHTFLGGFFSIDTMKIINLGYDGYGFQYSFYDARIIMGIICMIANFLHINIKIFYIIMLIMSLIISTITVMKIVEIVKEKKKEKNQLSNIFIIIIAYLFIFNFMTIDNMQWIENFVIALSIWFFILSAENFIIRNNIKKGILYCIIAVFCYQGTINMFIITIILFTILEYKTIQPKMIKQLIVVIAITLSIVLFQFIIKKVLESCINSMQPKRLNLQLYSNIIENFKNLPMLLWNSIYLFPSGWYLGCIAITCMVTCIYAIRTKNIKPVLIIILLFLLSIVSSFLLLCFYPKGIFPSNRKDFWIDWSKF